MNSPRLALVFAVFSGACAVGVAPDTHDVGVVVERDAGFGFDAGFPDDLAPTIDVTADDLVDAADASDAPDAPDVVFTLDLPMPVDRPVVIDRPPMDLGCGVLPGSACTPGASEACGNCGRRTCGSDCNWSACSGEGACAAGATRTNACGNCGTQTQRCSAACAWADEGGCAGSGPCAPGATQAGGCDQCSQQVCQGNCQWGGCGLRPGAACEYQAGRHHRSCSACACGLQFCLNSCQWSGSCVSCCSSCGGCQ